ISRLSATATSGGRPGKVVRNVTRCSLRPRSCNETSRLMSGGSHRPRCGSSVANASSTCGRSLATNPAPRCRTYSPRGLRVLSRGLLIVLMVTSARAIWLFNDRGQQLRKWRGGEADGAVGDPVGDHQGVGVNERAAGVDDVGHVAVLFVASGAEQWASQLAEHPGRIVEVKQNRADAIRAHGSDAVGEHQPPCVGFDWRAAISEL